MIRIPTDVGSRRLKVTKGHVKQFVSRYKKLDQLVFPDNAHPPIANRTGHVSLKKNATKVSHCLRPA